MKKLVALLVVAAFVVSLVGEVLAQNFEEEAAKVRAYLKVIDAKIKDARAKKQTARLKKLQAEKAATLARWNKLKASMEAAPPPPPPAPVAPVPPPPPAPVAVKPAAPAGLFGMGLNTVLTGAYVNTGKGTISGSVGALGSLVLDDFVGLGPMIGLSANAIKYTVGAGAYYGGGGLKAIPVRAGGIITLPADLLGGLESYLAGGLNYVVYGNGQTTGKIGGDAAFGINVDLGLGLGKTGIELGTTVVRSNTVSTGLTFSFAVSQPIVL